MNNQQQDYKQLLSQVIKKQIVILGPDITLAKARNVQGLVVADDGSVTDITGDPQQITQKLIDQFVMLSGEIVRKTMEPLLSMNQNQTIPSQPPANTPSPAVTPEPAVPQPIISTESPSPKPDQTNPEAVIPDATNAQETINESLKTPSLNPEVSTPNLGQMTTASEPQASTPPAEPSKEAQSATANPDDSQETLAQQPKPVQ